LISTEQIRTLLESALSPADLVIKVDGSHANITVVSAVFDALSRVKKQQLVYAPLKELIASGELHAVSIKTYTPTEWQRQKKLANLS
jgi:acid stress-induced BolA-like protein IbaG/YrbA